jgi:hypothetical protein
VAAPTAEQAARHSNAAAPIAVDPARTDQMGLAHTDFAYRGQVGLGHMSQADRLVEVRTRC